MSKTLTTTQTNLISLTRNSAGGSATLSFALTARVSKCLEWPAIPSGTGEWTPEVSSYEASVVELKPINEDYVKFRTQIDIIKIDGITVQQKSEKTGKNAKKAKKKKVEVLCKIHFNQEDGCAKLERYLLSGDPSTMTVTYTDTPVQEELPADDEVTADPDSQQAVLEGIEQDAAGKSDGESADPEEEDVDVVEGVAPTHAEKVKERKAESQRKRSMVKDSGIEAVQ